MSYDVNAIFREIEKDEAKYIKFWEDICNIETLSKETDELFAKLREVSLANGLGDLIPIESGGGSDSAYTQLAGVPSVCAVGACGDYCHTVNEYAEIDSLVKRAKLLAATTVWR